MVLCNEKKKERNKKYYEKHKIKKCKIKSDDRLTSKTKLSDEFNRIHNITATDLKLSDKEIDNQIRLLKNEVYWEIRAKTGKRRIV